MPDIDTTIEALAEEIVTAGKIDLTPEQARTLLWMLTGSLADDRYEWLRHWLGAMAREMVRAFEDLQQVRAS